MRRFVNQRQAGSALRNSVNPTSACTESENTPFPLTTIQWWSLAALPLSQPPSIIRNLPVGAELWRGLTEHFLTRLNWRSVEARWRWQPQEQLLHVRTCPVSKGYRCEIFLRGLVIDTGMLLWNKGKTQKSKSTPFRLPNITHAFWLKSDSPWSSV